MRHPAPRQRTAPVVRVTRANRSISNRLISWYRKNHRDLPWRRTSDPYRIWVSEIMLQQTQVGTVIPYFNRFITRFPTVSALASAPLEAVLKTWEGLGYYSRARNLHRAALRIAGEWNGRIPCDQKLLESLPGIGRSTAGAILSIAFGQKAPILDGNVKRVLCRLRGIEQDPKLPEVLGRLWIFSEDLVPSKDVGAFNQSLMELGATVCTPRSPACSDCPVRGHCLARQKQIQDRIPLRGGKKTIPSSRIWVAMIVRNGAIVAGPRPDRGLLAGMWGLPEIPAPGDASLDSKSVGCLVYGENRIQIDPGGALEPVVHTYTHRRVTYLPCLFIARSGAGRLRRPWKWIEISRLDQLPFPAASRRMLSQVTGPGASAGREFRAAESPAEYSPGPGR